jgi:hypothetical protein
MSQPVATIRERIQAQGFCGLDDAIYAQINYPLRLAPAICMVWGALGTALASPTILGALVPFALLGAILPGHPFDVLYNCGLRHIFGTPQLPRYPRRRRGACVMATLMLSAAAWSFHAGMPVAGSIAGSLLVGAAFVNVSTGFCVPSFVSGLVFGKVVCAQTSENVPTANGAGA